MMSLRSLSDDAKHPSASCCSLAGNEVMNGAWDCDSSSLSINEVSKFARVGELTSLCPNKLI